MATHLVISKPNSYFFVSHPRLAIAVRYPLKMKDILMWQFRPNQTIHPGAGYGEKKRYSYHHYT
jgi:hypothetical protein